MSTNKRASGDDREPKKGSGKSPTGKKPKSKGFIETTGYRPNWLETGPLSPDMLESTPQDAEMTRDEFDALQASLQRFYKEEMGEESSEPPADVIAADPTEQEVAGEANPPSWLASETAELDALSLDDEAEAPIEAAQEAPLLDEGEQNDDPWFMDIPEAGPLGESAVYPAESPDKVEAGDADEFILQEEAAAIEEPVAVAAPALPPAAAKTKREKKSKKPKRRDRLSVGLLLASLILLAAAAFIYFVNPFSRIALGAASLARPAASSTATSPGNGSGAWCVQGDFHDGAPLPLIDTGTGGDILAEDRMFSLEHPIPQPGTHEWQVVDCNDSSLSFPAQAAWITTTEANQPVTFTFDSNERADPLFFPIPFVVSAEDDTTDFRVIGNFQEWNPDDPNGRMQRINIGLYQQVRKIARAGDYEAYVIAGGDENRAVDAYGRTTEPIPFSFQTERNSDYVVFLLDTDRGRASVMYDMPPVLTGLAYGNGYWLLSLMLTGLAALLLAALLLRWLILHNRGLQLESGCPNCGRQELMRISRRSGDRMLHTFGIPAYRYRCRNCTWEGTRLSETGAAISPGAAVVGFDDR